MFLKSAEIAVRSVQGKGKIEGNLMTTQTIANAAALGMGAHARSIDHVAIAVRDLEEAIAWYRDILGFEVVERRETKGKVTAMVSAVMKAGEVTIVLLQGTTEESQVSRYVASYGPGVQHLAVEVDDLEQVVEKLEAAGIEFETPIIRGSGLTQIFTRREKVSGMMFEIIQRGGTGGFSDQSVQQLFEELEKNDSF